MPHSGYCLLGGCLSENSAAFQPSAIGARRAGEGGLVLVASAWLVVGRIKPNV